MALRFRRDVRKASYYVWFLGSDEAKGLRGSQVINSSVPYLISKAQHQEPIKVTLQVSHKGIKIVQGGSKTFIPHSAITCATHSDDIVACIFLIYNPATKCQLHVHAYRCDSEATAQALYEQIQVLINRPENQKRFTELESRLGTFQFSIKEQSIGKTSDNKFSKKQISSLGSDTGNSTRESESSEEHSMISPMSPIPNPRGNLFDSLAAELRAKFNGKGAPLLLPPRDYDTIHRSKGNIAATEYRRCQNSLIVGPKTSFSKNISSSRGSSGIGSDLAPSPERQDDIHTSSEDESWIPAKNRTLLNDEIRYDTSNQHHKKGENYNSSYQVKTNEKNYNNEGYLWHKEQEIKPIIFSPSDLNAKFRNILLEKPIDIKDIQPVYKNGEDNNLIPERKYRKHSEDKKNIVNPKYSPDTTKYKKVEKSYHNRIPSSIHQTVDNFSSKENMLQPIQRTQFLDNHPKDEFDSIQKHSKSKHSDKKYLLHQHRISNCLPIENEKHGDSLLYYYDGRNPYDDPENLPYRDSIDRMIRSPIMTQKQLINKTDEQINREKYLITKPTNYYERKIKGIYHSGIDDSERHILQDVKRKHEKNIYNHNIHEKQGIPRNLLYRRGSFEVPNNNYDNFSDDEYQNNIRQKHSKQLTAYPPLSNSKSLFNLAKGSRHSYAEPLIISKSPRRVGLAAVNPF